MEQVILWLFHSIVDLVNAVLSWKLIGNFSLLHFILGGVLITAILSLISFGTLNIGGTADYVGGIRRTRNRENAIDREKYSTHSSIVESHKVVNGKHFHSKSMVTSRRLKE